MILTEIKIGDFVEISSLFQEGIYLRVEDVSDESIAVKSVMESSGGITDFLEVKLFQISNKLVNIHAVMIQGKRESYFVTATTEKQGEKYVLCQVDSVYSQEINLKQIVRVIINPR